MDEDVAAALVEEAEEGPGGNLVGVETSPILPLLCFDVEEDEAAALDEILAEPPRGPSALESSDSTMVRREGGRASEIEFERPPIEGGRESLTEPDLNDGGFTSLTELARFERGEEAPPPVAPVAEMSEAEPPSEIEGVGSGVVASSPTHDNRCLNSS